MGKIRNTVFALFEDENSRQIVVGVVLTLIAAGTFLFIVRLTTKGGRKWGTSYNAPVKKNLPK